MTLTFDAKAVGFSLVNAKACAIAAKLAYTEPPTIASPLNHILIVETAEAVVFSFRGTASIPDFVTDARAWLRHDATRLTGRIHAGFDLAFDSTITQVVAALKQVPAGKRIFFVGHSLGGAQAALHGFYFGADFPEAQVYTYGQPRVGDRHYAAESERRLKGRHFRLINMEDIVPRLAGLIAGYRHSGEVHFFPSFVSGLWSNPPLALLVLSDAWGIWQEYRKGHLALLDDHYMDSYAAKLNQL